MAKMKKKSIQEKKPDEDNNSSMVDDKHVDNVRSNRIRDLLDSRDDATLSELVELRDRLTKGDK